MKSYKRGIKDPHYGRGVGIGVDTAHGTYGVDVCAGLTRNLFEVQLAVTPPFDYERFNSGDKYENVTFLKTISAKVSLFWIQISISFYMNR